MFNNFDSGISYITDFNYLFGYVYNIIIEHKIIRNNKVFGSIVISGENKIQ